MNQMTMSIFCKPSANISLQPPLGCKALTPSVKMDVKFAVACVPLKDGKAIFNMNLNT
jgi:hypothetical protein